MLALPLMSLLPAGAAELPAASPLNPGVTYVGDQHQIKVSTLGPNNVLVSLKGEDKILMIPVEESHDDSRIDLLVDCNIATTFYVRLASSRVDYYVPLYLKDYAGKDVAFNIVLPDKRRFSTEQTAAQVCWEKMYLTDSFTPDLSEKYRPLFHHAPLWGWMNDPNGMFYKDGQWHLYFQANPYGSKWQNMTWGHAVSSDLISWRQLPFAIRPNGLGAVFSGSCVVDKANTAGFGKDAVVALYTSAATSQIQSLAHSDDNGTTFAVDPANPVLTLGSEARDPNMFWHAPSGKWIMLLAHALEHEMLIFSSPDLKQWSLESAFGKGLGCQDGVWECPDLMQIPVAGSDSSKWVLICNINPGGPFGGSAAQYFVGDFDGHKFTPDLDADGQVPLKWLDYGKDNYATVSWSNAPEGRHTVIGWMSNWQYANDVPTLKFRSSNTLPRDLSLFRHSDGQYYVASAPVPELDALRGSKIYSRKSANVGSRPLSIALPKANDGICEISLTLDPKEKAVASLELLNAMGEKCVLTFNPADRSLSFDRRQSGMVEFSRDFPAVTTVPVFSDGDKLSLRIFIDRASVEVFGDGGRSVMTNLVFPSEPYSRLNVSSASGKTSVGGISVFELKSQLPKE